VNQDRNSSSAWVIPAAVASGADTLYLNSDRLSLESVVRDNACRSNADKAIKTVGANFSGNRSIHKCYLPVLVDKMYENDVKKDKCPSDEVDVYARMLVACHGFSNTIAQWYVETSNRPFLLVPVSPVFSVSHTWHIIWGVFCMGQGTA
jgi:hypothetical protein